MGIYLEIIDMFYIDKYAPKSIGEAKFNIDLLYRLQHMSKNESIPHMLFCGGNGSGKQTVIRLLLEMLFDKDVHKTEDSVYTVSGSSNKAVNVTVKQSNYHIVIEPNNNNFDRYLIQDIVKEYAKKMPLTIFQTKKIFKIVLINNIDNLSYYAQTSLRRTMEKYSSTCRFIMWCTCPTRVIEPLISRCVFFTISSPSNEQLFSYVYEISIKEKLVLGVDDYTYILDCAQGNIKEALWLLQLYKFGYGRKNIYYFTIDIIVRIIISHRMDQISTNVKVENKLYVRDLLYNIMITNISGTRILRDVLNKLCDNVDVPDECKYQILEICAYYEHNLVRGRRNIIHLEAPIVKIMKILKDYVVVHPEYGVIFENYKMVLDAQPKTILSVKPRRKAVQAKAVKS
ncbi:MAG: replication factor C small subunit [Hyperionvirus sp.]|uniref:Replication factor C small subunit n=1 Tax=Hyperionvirus sp. TaxID=2487770 RepID=A0A3G5AEY7_9VIRU|nr:MAG: replication factor C small subunit [Hyperionvirus sp.]